MKHPRKTLLVFLVPLLLAAEALAWVGEISAGVLGEKWQVVVRSPDFNEELILRHLRYPRKRFPGKTRDEPGVEQAFFLMDSGDANRYKLPEVQPDLARLLGIDPATTNVYCLIDELSSLRTLLSINRNLLGHYAEHAAGQLPQEDFTPDDLLGCQAYCLIDLLHREHDVILDFDAAKLLVRKGQEDRKRKDRPSYPMKMAAEELKETVGPLLTQMSCERIEILARGIEQGCLTGSEKETFIAYWTHDTARRGNFPEENVRAYLENEFRKARESRMIYLAVQLAESVLASCPFRTDSPLSPTPTTNGAPAWLSGQTAVPVAKTAPLFAAVFAEAAQRHQREEVGRWTREALTNPPPRLALPGFHDEALASLQRQLPYHDDGLPVLVSNAVHTARTNLVVLLAREAAAKRMDATRFRENILLLLLLALLVGAGAVATRSCRR